MAREILAQFPQTAPKPKYSWNSTTRLTGNLDRAHLILNKALKALDYFSSDPVHDLGVFRHFFLKYLGTQKTGITQSSDDLSKRVRPHLMWNVELKTLVYFRCIPPHDPGYLGPVFQIYLMPKYSKTGKTSSSDSFYVWLRTDRIWKVVLKTICITFYVFLFWIFNKNYFVYF